jgi:hypothetical protein
MQNNRGIKTMQTLELFSGTKSFSKVAKEKYQYNILTVDNDKDLNPDICIDIMDFNINQLQGYKPDIIWASPPCTQFTVASMGRNWRYAYKKDKKLKPEDYLPANEKTKQAIEIIKKTMQIIYELNPKYFYIENPRAVLRKLDLIPYPFATVTYCQYGFTNMKPTDIWSNNRKWQMVAKSCKNGMSCHESAPRGSKTGTQGIKGAKARGMIPPKLIEEILDYSIDINNS